MVKFKKYIKAINYQTIKHEKYYNNLYDSLTSCVFNFDFNENSNTWTLSYFKWHFVPEKWPRMGKGVITIGLVLISFWDHKEVLVTGTKTMSCYRVGM